MREQSKPRIAYLARKGTSVIYLDEFSAAWIDLEKSRLGREVTTEDIKERYPAGHLDKARRWNNTDDIAKAAEEFYSSLREDIRT